MEEKIQQEKLVEKKNGILELLPAASIFVIILALIKQFIYYSIFNIPIGYFLNLSELGLLVSDYLLFFIPFLTFLLLIFLGKHRKL
jgi:hypothetical protein